MRSKKKNCTQVLLKFHEYYVPVLELSLTTTNRCTQAQLIIKILVPNKLKYYLVTSVVIVIREGPVWITLRVLSD